VIADWIGPNQVIRCYIETRNGIKSQTDGSAQRTRNMSLTVCLAFLLAFALAHAAPCSLALAPGNIPGVLVIHFSRLIMNVYRKLDFFSHVDAVMP
jgi:hypothetical protein